jgi:hypothetical protein
MRRVLALVSLAALSLVASSVLQAQDNPFVGTWKLNLAKSKFIGTRAPKSKTRSVVAQRNGEKVSYDGIAADGDPISYSYTTNLDGKDAPYSGNQPFGADTIAVTRVDANTVTAVLKKGGKTLVTTKSVVSKDGKVTTNTEKGANAQGQPINQVTVWEKQ